MPLQIDVRPGTAPIDYLSRIHRIRELTFGYEAENDIVDKFRGDEIGFITEGLGQYREDSWGNWRTILKAAFGVPLQPDELEFFHDVAGDRQPPPARVKELWVIGGRRGGKDSVAAGVATQAACYADVGLALRPGERALVACFATDKDQAGIVHSYINGNFASIPALRRKVVGDLPNSYLSPITLDNRTEIRVVTNNFKAPRGRPIPVAIFDEVAFWRDEKSATPDVETYNAVYPSMAAIENSMLIGISTAYRQKGLLFEKWKEHFGKDDPKVLVIVATTRQLRPSYPQDVIDEALKKDYEANAAEYLSMWRRDLQDYVAREVVEAAVDKNIPLRPPVLGINYVAFCDPSGGSRDSMTLAIAHSENNKGILDCLLEVRPPFEPTQVVKQFSDTLKQYRVSKVRGDRYAGVWPAEQFRLNSVIYETSEMPKSDIYRNFLPLLNSGMVRMLDHERLVNQLSRLERRTARGGRDTVDHPPNEYDDVANAASGVLLMAAGKVNEAERWAKAYG